MHILYLKKYFFFLPSLNQQILLNCCIHYSIECLTWRTHTLLNRRREHLVHKYRVIFLLDCLLLFSCCCKYWWLFELLVVVHCCCTEPQTLDVLLRRVRRMLLLMLMHLYMFCLPQFFLFSFINITMYVICTCVCAFN